MISKEQIKKALYKIAENYNIGGESVEYVSDVVTFLFFHNQFEIANAVQESSLVTAKLLNSKIKACMTNFYSVYRGRNARVELNFKANTLIDYKKFDVIYKSNTFNLYAEDAIYRTQYSDTPVKGVDKLPRGIFCKSLKHELELTVTEKGKYFIDVVIDRSYLGNLSEDVKVEIDGVPYPTTRDFHDHVNTPIPRTNDDPLDKLFILTIPDYGIRIFKKGWWSNDGQQGYFRPNQVINIQCFEYTTLDDINLDDVKKVIIPGTELIPYEGYLDDDKTPKVEGDEGRLLIEATPRNPEASLLYNANLATRVQSQILSNSDINVLFTEFFIDEVESALNWYNPDNNNLYIYYIPRTELDLDLPEEQVQLFVDRHKSYFITQDIIPLRGVLCTINIDLTIFVNGDPDLIDINLIKNIFNKYSNKLNSIGVEEKVEEYLDVDEDAIDIGLGGSFINNEIIKAEITRIPNVVYVKNLVYSKFYIKNVIEILDPNLEETPIPVFIYDKVHQERVPIYYRFEVMPPNYRNAYEVVSK
jgi:hypothetical protein